MAFEKYGNKSGPVVLLCLAGVVVTFIGWNLALIVFGTALFLDHTEEDLNWFSHEVIVLELTGLTSVAVGTLVTPPQAWVISAWINAATSLVMYELWTVATIARPWLPRPWDVDDYGSGLACGGTALFFTALGIWYHVRRRLVKPEMSLP